MANSPVPDQSEDFLSRMTLITDPRSDKYLKRVKKSLESDKCQDTDSDQKNM